MLRNLVSNSFIAIFASACFVVFGNATMTNGQCPSFSFSAAAGPSYHEITLTVGGQINGTATVQVMDGNGQWVEQMHTIATGSFTIGGYSHNQTVQLRATNGGDCIAYIYATATTFDVGQPWLSVSPGPGNSVYVQSGAVAPDLNSGVLWSYDGGQTFVVLSVWQTLPPNFDPPQLVSLAPGVTYYFQAFIDLGTTQRYTSITTVRLAADQDYGSCSIAKIVTMGGPAPTSPNSIGKPVNVINGNMYLSQTDYQLPGGDLPINLTRHYNSLLQLPGMFGLGWTTEYDQYLTQIDAKNIRLQMPDGRGVYFARVSTSGSFSGITPGFPGNITINGDGTYTLSFNDGRVNKYDSTGKLLWLKDRNSNQTTVNYDANGIMTGITDAFGRTLNISLGSNGYVSQVSDTIGAIAIYEYYSSTNLLKSVTY